ncbi:unnamed protein product [Discula destructiva]
MDTTSLGHICGPPCRLAAVVDLEPDDALLKGIPPIKAQYFYHSMIPIDDPLSTATIPVSSSSDNTSRAALRPFSQADTNALERAWLSLATESFRSSHQASLAERGRSASLAAASAETLQSIVDTLCRKHKQKHANEAQLQAALEAPSDALASNTATPVCCQELLIDASNLLREAFCELTRRNHGDLDQGKVIECVMAAMEKERPTSMALPPCRAPPTSTSSPRNTGFVATGLSTSTRGRASSLVSDPPGSRAGSTDSRPTRQPMSATHNTDKSAFKPASAPVRSSVDNDGISGKPFHKVDGSKAGADVKIAPTAVESPSAADHHNSIREEPGDRPSTSSTADSKAVSLKRAIVEVPVGISRLHLTSLPALQMKPLYWSPVNDIAIVTRATWFYRDTMIPLEPAVANQLEAGYRDLRPYSDEWKVEIRCAVEVGAEGEEKVSWPLWPTPSGQVATKRNAEVFSEPKISSDPFCAAHCFRGEAAAEGTLEPAIAGDKAATNDPRSYANYHVVYKDASLAFLLKPSLKPSAYYSRKPVSKIMKGMTLGTPVVRGFDRKTWEALHEKKRPANVAKASLKQALHEDQGSRRTYCPGCEADQKRGQVTDLVLVAHGIGQKFAERVESYHFTHAVTAFRRSINIEAESPTVRPVFRDGFDGIMVLPVNWRHTLSLEDGGPAGEEEAANSDGFSLKDIEPGTIPAVRSLVSDVMFDIPFYMSQHKPKMIQALVAEANRVYRLWCRNNPGFAQHGRVHLIAHSLGSIMAVDILSRQPDALPPLDLSKPTPESSFFEFDTTNLFLLGSPAGFFLLLERSSLWPRRGRQKPGVEASDYDAKEVTKEAGAFGCIAVDNIYNVLAKEDPIAYLLNGTIDPVYAGSLKMAHVPSKTSSWAKSIGDAMRGLVPLGTAPTATDLSAPVLTKPPTFRLPSQLELDVHDFTREEIAERKAFLLNDNGQVDFYLRSGTGPLELQYLNMLSAHTSYWTNADLVRLLCVEIGREPGRANTLPVMRAVKMTRRDRLAR